MSTGKLKNSGPKKGILHNRGKMKSFGRVMSLFGNDMEVSQLNTQSSHSSINPDTETVSGTRENIGRWNSTEHELFLQGLAKHGKDWKAIAAEIPTRSVVQVRTHAQKYFQKASTTNARVLTPIQRVKRRDAVTSYRQEEQEKTESEPSSVPSPEVSGSTTPNSTDTSRSELSANRSVSKKEGSSHHFAVRFPREAELIIDYDMVGLSHKSPYMALSPFELECNDYQDDMEEIQSNPIPFSFENI